VNPIAKAVSVLFHPLLMATYLFLLLSYTLPSALDPIPMEGQQNFILLIFIVTFLLPVMNIGLFKILGSIRSITFQERRDRLLPFSLITIFYGFVTYLFYAKFRIGLHDNVLKLMLILDLLVAAATVATFFYKVSIHTLCMWGLLGIIIPLNKVSDNSIMVYPSIVILFLTGLVMSSRLQLNAHTSSEIWFGALLGFAVSFIGMTVFF